MKSWHWIILLTLGILSCAREGLENKEALWQEKYRIEIKEMMTIGTETGVDTPYSFSTINDIRVDLEDHIYILDRKESRLTKFNEKGEHVLTIPLPRGQGPGEVGNPLFFDVNRSGEIFVTDNRNSKVVQFDRNGIYRDSIHTEFIPGRIHCADDESIYVLSGAGSHENNVIHKFDLAEKREILSFCPDTEEGRAYKRVGGEGEVCVDDRGDVFYSFAVPYKIRQYRPGGEKVREFSRFYKSENPLRNNEAGLPYSKWITDAITPLSNQRVLNVFFDREKDEAIRLFDIFDNEGRWLLGFEANEYFGDWDGRLVRADRHDNLYLEYWQPYPRIKKFSFKVVAEKNG